MKKTLLLMLLPALLLSASCGGGRKTSSTEAYPHPTKHQTWRLVKMQERPLRKGMRPVTIVFNSEAGSVKGQSACNRYYADYTLRGDALKLQGLGWTDVACPEWEMNVEQRYLWLLSKVTRMHIEADTMTLYQKNKAILKYCLQ